MPTYRIHRLRDHLRQHVRYAPHVSGTAIVKPRDYRSPNPEELGAGDQVDAPTPYAAFFALRDTAAPLDVGDLLEAPDGSLRIFKFVGFEEAQWAVPEPQPASGLPAPDEVSTALQ